MPRSNLNGQAKEAQPLPVDHFVDVVRKGVKRLEKSYVQCERSANTENVHRLRRAIRHMRTLLDVCRQWRKDDRLNEVHERIRNLQHLIGPLRDKQVRVDALHQMVERSPELKPLLRRAEKEEREERVIVVDLLEDEHLKDGAIVRRRIKRNNAKKRPRQALMKSIEREREQLHNRWSSMRADDQQSMHRVRVALRRLTHLVSTMADHLGPEVTTKLPELKRTQQRLGRLHDAQVFMDWARLELPRIPAERREAVMAYLDRSSRQLARREAAFLREHRRPPI